MMLNIRRFSQGDERQCEQLLKDSFKWYLELEGSEWITDKLSSKQLLKTAEEGVTLVAEDEGRVCGFLHMATAPYGVGYISTVGVAPGLQRKGIGKSLITRAESEARNLGIRKIWLMVTHINTSGINFYSRNGYLPEGLLRDMTIEGAHELIMSKHL